MPASFDGILSELENAATLATRTREGKWRQEGAARFERSVISALMVRQFRLFSYFVRSPIFWDTCLGPILLRIMLENVIVIEWISKDLDRRSLMFIKYGLGQARLIAENAKKKIDESGEDEDLQKLSDLNMAWVETQRLVAMVDINLGNWADKDLRQMADEVGLGDLYRFAFVPFSAAVHGSWNHVGLFDVRPCANRLHKPHLVGNLGHTIIHEDFLFRACKYFDLFFDCVDRILTTRSRRKSLRHIFVKRHPALTKAMRRMFKTTQGGRHATA